MKYLSDAGYDAITLREFVAMLKSETLLPVKTVVLTFDDGFRNFYTEAFPVLSEFNFRATVFLVTDFCGGHNDWSGNPKELPRSELLDWKEIRELDETGIEFGSHTKTHPDLTRLSTNDMTTEMLDSKAKISYALGRDVSTFAYPYGRSNHEVRRIALENFDASCSTNLGKVSAGHDRASLNRIDTYYLSNQRLFEMLPTAAFDNYLFFRRAMRKVRSVLAPVGYAGWINH
jgi:peptidoglycan/xylan/chitin deacetylase (PgdA/CDA1 family)